MTVDPGVYGLGGGDLPPVSGREVLWARRHIEWDAQQHPDVQVVDLTCGRWPYVCQARSARGRTCTRIAGHTGRHAAGSFGWVLEVWAGIGPHQERYASGAELWCICGIGRDHDHDQRVQFEEEARREAARSGGAR